MKTHSLLGYFSQRFNQICFYYPFQLTANNTGIQGLAALCGRLGQALKSDTYGDFHLGQLTQVNIVAVSG